MALASTISRLPPEVNRILYVRNLPYKISSEEIYDVFGRFGAIRQIRLGNTNETRGTAFVVYEDIFDAKNACEHLSGFNVAGRYLVVMYYHKKKSGHTDVNKVKVGHHFSCALCLDPISHLFLLFLGRNSGITCQSFGQ